MSELERELRPPGIEIEHRPKDHESSERQIKQADNPNTKATPEEEVITIGNYQYLTDEPAALIPVEARLPGSLDIKKIYFSSNYFQKYKVDWENTPLGDLNEHIMAPIVETGEMFIPEKTFFVVTSKNSQLREEASKITNLSYNANYNLEDSPSREIEDVAHDSLDNDPNTHTLVLAQAIGGKNIPLASHRMLAGDELDIFGLFDLNKGHVWPHQQNPGRIKKPGEIGRLSFHPMFNIFDDPELKNLAKLQKSLLVRALWAKTMDVLRNYNVEVPYFVLAHHVQNFAKRSGINAIPIEGAKPSEKSLALRRKFKYYWCPDGPLEKQPAACIAPWELDNMKWKLHSGKGIVVTPPRSQKVSY